MADHPTYQIRPLSREEIESIRDALHARSKNIERFIPDGERETELRLWAFDRLKLNRALARDLLSMMGAKPQVSSSIDHHQQTGAAWDIINEALNAYHDWLLDDDYDYASVVAIMVRMKERAELHRPSIMEATDDARAAISIRRRR